MAHKQLVDSAFARVGNQLVYVHDSAQWPDTADAELHVTRAPTGQPLRHLEVPVSESGDWHLALVHYFDAQGRTQRFVSEGRYFREGCGSGVMVDRRVISFRPDFTVLQSQRTLLDSRGVRVDSSACGHGYDFFAGTPRPSFEALRQAGIAR